MATDHARKGHGAAPQRDRAQRPGPGVGIRMEQIHNPLNSMSNP